MARSGRIRGRSARTVIAAAAAATALSLGLSSGAVLVTPALPASASSSGNSQRAAESRGLALEGQVGSARSSRRDLAVQAASALLASSAAPAANAADNCEGSVFEGTYTVPESLGGTATITVRAAVAVARGTVNGRPWEVKSTRIQGAPLILRLGGVARQIWFDFSPLGGPKELHGSWAGGPLDVDIGEQAIAFDDGTKWKKTTCSV
mmetsp:Transcript_41735/g.108091  ORF Transcript_41735/g.108091 Transcript_41735/m.108091 type:complete len:207 (-) Transcript_41735:64-684(-)